MELATRNCSLLALCTGVVAMLIFCEIIFCLEVGDGLREFVRNTIDHDYRFHHPLRMQAISAAALVGILALKFSIYGFASRRLLQIEFRKSGAFLFLTVLLLLVSLGSSYVSFIEVVGFSYDL